jgi:uncharacterized lipoprotein YajG
MTLKIACVMLAVAVLLAGCQEPAPPSPEARPVLTVTVERRAGGVPVSLTGADPRERRGELRVPD